MKKIYDSLWEFTFCWNHNALQGTTIKYLIKWVILKKFMMYEKFLLVLRFKRQLNNKK